MTSDNLLSRTSLYRLCKRPVLLKCEWQTLTGTPKARFVWERLNRLEAERAISPGMTLTDVSTGSEAAALAQIGALRGYKIRVWLPNYMTQSYLGYLKRFGAIVELVHSDTWLLEGAHKAREAGSLSNSYYFNQADALEDAVAAYSELGREMGMQAIEAGWSPTAFICVVGSGGLLLGTITGVREVIPEIKCYAIELDCAPYLHSCLHQYKATIKPHHVWGISGEGSSRIKDALVRVIDDVVLLSEPEMNASTLTMPSTYGISVDYPTASNILGAERLYGEAPGAQVLTIWTGHGWRTLS